jgi:L-ascorbate metabolism protein UlaG (beta-lactamase superfamily)
VQPRTKQDFDAPPNTGLRVTWLGHSTLLVELDHHRVLVDPVWAERASPLTWAGPRRFYAPPLPLRELPRIDAVIISHDHYDHLDHSTVVKLSGLDTKWLVPLGVGAHLEYWGVPKSRITELDWWEQAKVAALTFTCTPARHFSGRSLVLADQNATLWAGWAIAGPAHRVFYSGDTALHPDFTKIGERLGPFDVTMIETGAYNSQWRDVHLGPEQAVIAHQLVRGEVLLPVHWGLFDLAPHSWTEPAQRVIAAARKADVVLVLPRPGGWVEPDNGPFVDKWWREDIPWKTVEEDPVWSTSVEALLRGSVLYTPPPTELPAPPGGPRIGQ